MKCHERHERRGMLCNTFGQAYIDPSKHSGTMGTDKTHGNMEIRETRKGHLDPGEQQRETMTHNEIPSLWGAVRPGQPMERWPGPARAGQGR